MLKRRVATFITTFLGHYKNDFFGFDRDGKRANVFRLCNLARQGNGAYIYYVGFTHTYCIIKAKALVKVRTGK